MPNTTYSCKMYGVHTFIISEHLRYLKKNKNKKIKITWNPTSQRWLLLQYILINTLLDISLCIFVHLIGGCLQFYIKDNMICNCFIICPFHSECSISCDHLFHHKDTSSLPSRPNPGNIWICYYRICQKKKKKKNMPQWASVCTSLHDCEIISLRWIKLGFLEEIYILKYFLFGFVLPFMILHFFNLN